MIKIFRIFGFVFLIVLLFLIFLGLYSHSSIEIENTCHLHVPHSQVWQLLTDGEKITYWTDKIKYVKFENRNEVTKGSQFKLYLESKDYISLQIRDFKENSLIVYDLLLNQKNPVINDYNITIGLKSLRDGSTEVNCKINYYIKNFSGKIANKLYFEENQSNILKQHMDLFRKYLEKV